MELDEIIALTIFGGLIANAIILEFVKEFLGVKEDLINTFTSKGAFIVYGTILFLIFFYFNYKANKWIIKKNEERRVRKEQLKKDIREARELLSLDVNYLDSDELKEHLEKLGEILGKIESDKGNVELKQRIEQSINEIGTEIPIVIRKEKVDKLRQEEYEHKESIKELEEMERQKLLDIRNLEETSLRKLNAQDNPVFIESDLTQKEKALLMKYRYKRAYEYCLDKQVFVYVLVKPTMRHSITHTFLVWSAKRMLNKLNGVTDVLDWDTRETDITFKYNKKEFALEVETGTLLKKKSQLRNKIDYLNSKYKERWMIIVSKKNLVSKYNQFGRVASRSEVPKKLKKLLKSASPS